MALVDVELGEVPVVLPAGVRRLVEEGERRLEAFIEGRLDDPIVGFVPSDFPAVYGTLEAIARRHLATGRLFCEWGSGFGVVAMLASALEFDACGIEIECDLVDAAQELAEAYDLPVEFICGSFIPTGGEDVADIVGDFAWLRTDAPSAYDELGLDPQDFDVIFAYPWPGEEQAVYDLFERYASTGALLVTFQGVEAVRVMRHVSG